MSELIKNIVTQGLENGEAKSVILTDLIKKADLDLTSAAAAYNSIAREEGLLLTNEEKEQLVTELVAQYTVEGTLDREPAEQALMERGHMQKTSATQRLKAYCTEKGIGFPASTYTKRDMTAVKAAISAWHEQGYDKEQILTGLKEHYQYSDNSAVEAYRKLGIELGFVEKRTSASRGAMVTWFKKNGAYHKKEVIALMQNPKERGGLGLTKSTAEGYYSMYLFAKEFAAS